MVLASSGSAAGVSLGSAYRALNPMAQVPTLEIVDDAGGSRFLGQSLAILQYLEDAHPEPSLLPRDAFLKARAWQLAEIVQGDMVALIASDAYSKSSSEARPSGRYAPGVSASVSR